MAKGKEFYTTIGRRKVDAPLYLPILSNAEAEQQAQQKSAAHARSLGLSTETIHKLYPMAR